MNAVERTQAYASGMSVRNIAIREGVSESAVRASIAQVIDTNPAIAKEWVYQRLTLRQAVVEVIGWSHPPIARAHRARAWA